MMMNDDDHDDDNHDDDAHDDDAYEACDDNAHDDDNSLNNLQSYKIPKKTYP
jgi:hypothetical protein